MNTSEEFNVGDVVMHRGRIMRIVEIKGDLARCQYEEHGEINKLFYKLSSLRKFVQDKE
jgi:hypothetical protein